MNLSGEHNEQRRNEGELSLVEQLNSSQNMSSINRASTRIGKNGDQNMLLYIEGSRIHSELEPRALEEGASGKGVGHQMAEGHNSNLGSNGRNGQWVGSVPEELVDKGEYDTSPNP